MPIATSGVSSRYCFLNLLVLLCLLPVILQAAPSPLQAEIKPGVVPMTQSKRGWLPNRLVFSWRNQNYTALMLVNAEKYNEYEHNSRTRGNPTRSNYGAAVLKFALEGQNDVRTLALALKRAVPDHSSSELAAFVLSLVQALPYKLDALTTPSDETWRTPLQTLVDTNVDCEDSTMLYLSLLSVLGIDSAAVLVPGHMLAGVAGNFSGAKVNDYFLAETTGLGWKIGDLPEVLETRKIQLISIPAYRAGNKQPVIKTRSTYQTAKPQKVASKPKRNQSSSGSFIVYLFCFTLLGGIIAWLAWEFGWFSSRQVNHDEDRDSGFDDW